MNDCVFGDRCNNSGQVECYTCQYNPYSCTQSYFDWNGKGDEPTNEELDIAIES